MNCRAVIFDAYGTLFDVESVVLQAGSDLAGDMPALSSIWRRKQLQYTWLRSLMDRYEDFWEVTRSALQMAMGELKIELSEAQTEGLMEAYLHPSAFPETRRGLDALRDRPLAILSNGTPKMLAAAIKHNGLEPCFAHVISVDGAKTYKPAARVYALGPEMLGIPAAEILFVSSNSWDAAGAKAFGYRVCWCNRSGEEMERLGFAPDLIVARLDQIASRVR